TSAATRIPPHKPKSGHLGQSFATGKNSWCQYSEFLFSETIWNFELTKRDIGGTAQFINQVRIGRCGSTARLFDLLQCVLRDARELSNDVNSIHQHDFVIV